MRRLCIYRYLLLGLVSILAITGLSPYRANAEVIYPTFTKDEFGHFIYTQPAYLPKKVIGTDITVPDPNDMQVMVSSPLSKPKDVYIDSKDHIYIADTGNNRIVHYNADYQYVRTIELKDHPFKAPEGVFVNEKGEIFVADTGNRRVVHLDAQGSIIKVITKPQSRFVPKDLKFDPIKVVEDQFGYIYVATLGGYRGLIQLDAQGRFQSFYGANATAFTMLDHIKKVLYSRKMFENELSKLPLAITNVALGADGFVYSVTGTADSRQVKRHDYMGRNNLNKQIEETSSLNISKGNGLFARMARKVLGITEDPTALKFGEILRRRVEAGLLLKPHIIDAAVDRNGNLAVVDKNYHYISNYDNNGNLLFFWGEHSQGSSIHLGMMRTPSAISFNSRDELLLLDEETGVLQVFGLSEFGELVYTANNLTNDGFYEESEAYWQQVIQLNTRFGPAWKGLAMAAYKKGDFERAKEYFLKAGDQGGYSDAFWQIRLTWFQERFSLFATLFLALAMGYWLLGMFLQQRKTRASAKEIKPRKTWVLLEQLKHSWYMLKHPIDGFTAIRYESKGGYLSAFILIVLMYIVLVIDSKLTSFTFNKVIQEQINVITILGKFASVWFAWVVCNYLISSIYRGEGRFKDVFIGSAYALMPFILFGAPLSLISNGMTLSEASIYNYILYGIIIWTGTMMFWQVQSIQNYSVGETVVNIVLTLFAMAVLALLLFIIYGLTNELFIFIYEVYQEVSLR